MTTDRTPDAIRDLEDLFGPPISVYTRAQALADGELIDLTPLAHEYGFTIPVAITRAAHADLIAWDELTEKRKSSGTGQDETGRAWDVLTMARHAINTTPRGRDRLTFKVLRVPTAGRGTVARLALVAMVLGGDDTGKPCLTLMAPLED